MATAATATARELPTTTVVAVPEPKVAAALGAESVDVNLETLTPAAPMSEAIPKRKPAESVKKPSEIVLVNDPIQRDTGRMTGDLPNPNEILAKRKYPTTVCCCINPYVDEEPSIYAPGNYLREGDVYKHRTHMVRMVVCFNLCYSTEYVSKTIIAKAADGTPLTSVTVDDLNNINKYFMVKAEKCNHRHHDIRRYSNVGRILNYLCTLDGIASTLRKMICLEDCVDTVNVRTLRCERTLYSRRHF